MTDQQILTIALASVPNVLAVLVGILINNSRLGDLRAHMDAQFRSVDAQFRSVDQRFDAVDRRFEEMKEMWRSELHRVEEVLDARLKHLEER